ncbi:MAG TPA: DUF4062 domain-containing protein [Abditibacteriaceae bacterium]|jgi:hypothetical protein
MAQQKPRVFISSTVSDLTQYRQAVVEAIRELGLEPILQEIETVAINSGQPLEQVSQRIKTSDIIILIVGHRYGAEVPTVGKGWVELEYEIARNAGIPTLLFMAKEDAPWPPTAIDGDRSRISQFRRRLQNENLVYTFATPSDLAAGVVQGLTRFLVHSEQKKTSEPKSQKAGREQRQVRIIRLLLSSPGDVSEERDRISNAVFRFNQESVEERGLFIKLVRWEDMAPQIGPGAQNVINNQIGEYDLFIGIMWNRFGTPTDIAASGTKEEFDAAVELWRENRKPWITFYFGSKPANLTNVEQLDQKRLVIEFQADVRKLGVVRTFNGPDDFEDIVYRDLLRITTLPEFMSLLD